MFFQDGIIGAEQIHLRILAHLGDGVYELFVRECMMGELSVGKISNKIESVHRWTSLRSSATFQVQLLDFLLDDLDETERQLVKRARNMPVSVGRRSQQGLHRKATGFEALLGYWHLESPKRLEAIFSILTPLVLSGSVPVNPNFEKEEEEKL
ncbi:MAG: ribonuclease III domain-containing protein [Vampirovibrionales bacterium]|nr:ribonuclease III domain-containing protein [Vampirovibrionales bacterium]